MLVTMVFEVSSEAEKDFLFQHIDDRGFNYYVLENYWDIEKFTTVDEVEKWMEETDGRNSNLAPDTCNRETEKLHRDPIE